MRTAEHLSPRQQEILTYIQGFVDEHGYPPAIRQIQDSLNISSTSVVAYNLKALETKGVLQREGKVSRGIKLPQTTPVTLSSQSSYQVPLLGVITAGQPLLLPQEAQETATEFVEVSPEVASADRLKEVYALRVRGHSMIDALIDDGDIVLLRATNTAENGQMVAALIEDENSVTLKRFYKEGSRVRLQPANVTMDPIYVNADQIRVQGRVVGVIRSMF
ncbi:MAG TPA: transcriptional repressor LexA [Roseiflexaceae bacterium]|jgi:repressor LexA|nr:transcriptional repressor LexA [Roseiflexaceae bacterium]